MSDKLSNSIKISHGYCESEVATFANPEELPEAQKFIANLLEKEHEHSVEFFDSRLREVKRILPEFGITVYTIVNPDDIDAEDDDNVYVIFSRGLPQVVGAENGKQALSIFRGKYPDDSVDGFLKILASRINLQII